MELRIEGMTCGGCARSVTKAIQSVDAAAVVEADPAARSARVETVVSAAQVLRLLEDVGYPASVK